MHPEPDTRWEGEPRREPVGCVVVIADQEHWTAEIVSYLQVEGYEVVVDRSGASAFDQRIPSADAAIIQLDLAARSGEDVCVAWRSRTDAPILAVGVRSDERTVLSAFHAGADDFVPIEVTPRQLLARLRSLLRRTPIRRGRGDDSAADLAVTLDGAQRAAIVLGTKIQLTEQEHDVLSVLLSRPGRVVSRGELVDAMGARSGRTGERSLDHLVRRIREKLESVDTERRITTVRGVGFRFAVRPDEPAVSASRGGPTS